jgi:peptidoglycan/LPS O-acetylase OafA/YrhL
MNNVQRNEHRLPRQSIFSNASRQDESDSTKHQFEVLNGLRGSAALLVVLFHIQGITVAWNGSQIILHHAPMVVDFFFILSGFVIGHAYDDRWPRMSNHQFLVFRFNRLHPLLILGTLLGFISYVCDPFASSNQTATTQQLLLTLFLSLLTLPSAPLPNRWTATHSLNGPCWSLLQEYIGSVTYAFVLRHLSARILGVLALICGLLLGSETVALGSIDQGSGWDTIWMAPLRLSFSFVTGLWLFRVRDRLPRVRLGLWLLTTILAGATLIPMLPDIEGIRTNGVYETVCVVFLFPFIVLAGSHSTPKGKVVEVCRVGGRLSYSIYITHYPFLYLWMNYVANERPTFSQMVIFGLLLVPTLIFVAWAAYVVWDRPIRRILQRST